ncbi:unnamed protein product [Bathycoccus prasinos]
MYKSLDTRPGASTTKFKAMKQARFLPNSVLAFAPCKSSWHGVEERKIHQGITVGTACNAGHSAASWLKHSRASAIYYGFDAGRMFHRYPEENAKLLNELVGKDANGENRVRVTFGDSTKTLPKFVKQNTHTVICDLVHVDGGHFGDVPHADLWGMFQLSNRNTLLIMDDLHCTATWCKKPIQEWEKAKKEGWVKESGCRR